MSASTLLRSARHAAGISQRTLAQRSKRHQPQIADVERGRHDVTVEVLAELLAATGHRLVVVPTTRTTPAETAEGIRAALSADDADRALREALQLSDDLAACELPVRAALCAAVPQTTGDPRYDALVAGLVELHLPGRSCPSWARSATRVLPVRWWVDETPGLEELNLVETPKALLRHGVVLAAGELVSA